MTGLPAGAETAMTSPAEFPEFLHAETERLGTVIRERRIAAD